MSPCTRIAALVLASACGAARAGIPVVEPGYELERLIDDLVTHLASTDSPLYQQLIEARRQVDADEYNRAKAEALRLSRLSKTNAQPTVAAARSASDAQRPMQTPPTATQGETR